MGDLTIGYIGLGNSHSEAYLRTLEVLPVDVTCACGSKEVFDARFPALENATYYSDAEALLAAETPDAVWVTLPNRQTPAVIEAAATRNIDVYTEKSAARTAADLEAVLPTVRDSDSTVTVAYANRANPAAREMRRRAEAGTYGEYRHFEARVIASQLRFRDTDSAPYDHAASRGGILQWLGCHYIDLLQWASGDPIKLVNARTAYGTPDVDIEDGATLQFETESGALGTLTAGYYLPGGEYGTFLGIYATEESTTWRPAEGGHEGGTSLSLMTADEREAVSPARTLEYEFASWESGYLGPVGREYLEEVVGASRGDFAPFVATLEDELAVLRVLDAAYESASSENPGKWVEVDQ